MSLTLSFHGAAECVTGSCMRLKTERADVLIDCGMFQGSKTLKALNYDAFPFDARRLDAVLLTHAHIDHSGLLPKLMKAGFAGAIHATGPTRALCSIMLADAGGIQEMEVESLNRMNARRGRPLVEPIYTADDAEKVMQQFQSTRLNQWIDVASGVRARWWNAGHILGAGSIEVEAAQREGDAPVRLLFSGDIGSGASEFVDDPQGPAGVDHLILESTYGGVERANHDAAARRAALAIELRDAHSAGGPLVVPAFAIERSQELLLDMLHLMDADQAPPAPIFLDSPLAIKACDIFQTLGAETHGENPFARLRQSGWLRFTESAAESREIERFKGWHIIIAASGMCDAGRIRHHLKRLLWRPEVTVMMTGYQAVGTLGRLLIEGRSEVRIQGEPIRVRARIRNLETYSAHADGPGLLRWARARQPISGNVFLAHGEPPNTQALAQRLIDAGFERTAIERPAIDSAYRLKAGQRSEPASTTGVARIAPEATSQLDWHNQRVELLGELDERLRAAKTDEQRKSILDRVAGALR